MHRAAALAAAIAALAALVGCAGSKPAVYEREAFGSSATFSRELAASGPRTCEAARRALLSQGYIVDSAKADVVQAHKNFQPGAETHVQILFNVVCIADAAAAKGEERTTAFVNAVQDRYALKKTNNAASVGVSVLGSVSVPLPAGDDSMVKVASETINSGDFYTRWFALLERYLAESAPRVVPSPPEPAASIAGEPAR